MRKPIDIAGYEKSETWHIAPNNRLIGMPKRFSGNPYMHVLSNEDVTSYKLYHYDTLIMSMTFDEHGLADLVLVNCHLISKTSKNIIRSVGFDYLAEDDYEKLEESLHSFKDAHYLYGKGFGYSPLANDNPYMINVLGDEEQ